MMLIDEPLGVRDVDLASLIEAHARNRPDRIAFVEADERLSWRAFDDLVTRFAHGLEQAGVERGDRIALIAHGGTRTYAAFFGIIRAGAIPTPLSTMLSAELIDRLANDAGAVLLIRGPGLEELGEIFPNSRSIDWVLDQAGSEASFRKPPLRSHDVFSIIYSSGTTGTPKGIVHTHASRMWMANEMGWRFGIGPDSVVVLTTPPYSNGTNLCLLPAILHGATIHVSAGFDAGHFCRTAIDARPTHAFMVPTQFEGVLVHPSAAAVDWTCFEALITAGAPMPEALRERIWQTMGDRLHELWGLTEGVGTTISPGEMRRFRGSVGRAQSVGEIRIIDGAGADVTGRAAGEIVGRSPMIMDGYLNRPDANREVVWHDSAGRAFLRTGDIGEVDADGYLHIRGRLKDMIISGGFNIYPTDIEEILRGHPGVADAAVFGVPHPKWGETPVGYLRLVRGEEVDAGALMTWAAPRLSKLHRLSALRVFAGDFPRNALGKVLKTELRDRFLTDEGCGQ